MSDDQSRLVEALDFQRRFDARLAAIDASDDFDRTFGVETSYPVEPWEIEEATEATLAHNIRYSPTPVRTIREILLASPVRPEDVTFVDVGCGKGRVLLVASEFPFRRIVGVDFASGLCQTARENVARYRSAAGGRPPIEIHCQDARTFEIPQDAGFFYFYEPFTVAVGQRVLANIEQSLRDHPRPAVLCLVGRGYPPPDSPVGAGPGLASVVRGRRFWQQVGDVVRSPDHEYYDAWYFGARGAGP